MAFPIADDNRDRTTFPWLTIGLIAVNVLVFVLFQGLGANDEFTYAYATVPAEIVSGKDLVLPTRVEEVEGLDGQVANVQLPPLERTPGSVYLTLLTSMFMHGSLMHLLGNMWFLWIFGDNLEHDMGRFGYLVFYLVCGLIASLAHVFMNATGLNAAIPSLGASGAISGVMGGYLVLHPHRQVTVLLFRFLTQVPGWVAVGIWFVFQVINSFVDTGNGIAYAAHIGGFIAGAVIAGGYYFLRQPPSSKQEWDETLHRDRYGYQGNAWRR